MIIPVLKNRSGINGLDNNELNDVMGGSLSLLENEIIPIYPNTSGISGLSIEEFSALLRGDITLENNEIIPVYSKNSGVGGLNNASLLALIPLSFLKLKNTLLEPTVGNYPLFSRSSSAWFRDFEGQVIEVPDNVARFEGARFVYNLAVNTETPVTQNITVITGVEYIVSCGAGNLSVSGAFTGSITSGGEIAKTAATTTTLSVTITTATQLQVERVYGSQTAASEYVSRGVLSSPWHGPGADGVKFFDTGRAGAGAALTTLTGYLSESTSTNILPYSHDISQWVNTWDGGTTETQETTPNYLGTFSSDLAQIDNKGDANQTTTITVTQSTEYNVSFIIKNVDSTLTRLLFYDVTNSFFIAEIKAKWTGSVPSLFESTNASNIKFEATEDGYYRVSFSGTTSATLSTNAILIVYPENGVVATNSILLAQAQVTLGEHPTSIIQTDGTTVTRVADDLTQTITATTGDITQLATIQFENVITGNATILYTSDGTANNSVDLSLEDGRVRLVVIDGGVTQVDITTATALTTDTPHKIGIRCAMNDFSIVVDGVEVGTDNNGTVPTGLVTCDIGHTNALDHLEGTISDNKIYERAYTTAELIAETT